MPIPKMTIEDLKKMGYEVNEEGDTLWIIGPPTGTFAIDLPDDKDEVNNANTHKKEG